MLSQLKNLRTLNLEFNEIVKLDELCYFYSLEAINLSYNKLTTLDGMKGLNKLMQFTVTYNFLKKSFDEILTLKRYCPNLLHLDLRGNPLDKVRINSSIVNKINQNSSFFFSQNVFALVHLL